MCSLFQTPIKFGKIENRFRKTDFSDINRFRKRTFSILTKLLRIFFENSDIIKINEIFEFVSLVKNEIINEKKHIT